MSAPWETTVTAFAVARRGPMWLMVRHERLGTVSWELPGGHLEAGESLEEAAARETLEETGVVVEIGRLVATCVHEWHERRRRKLVCFFEATAAGDTEPTTSPDEDEILEAAWADPFQVDPVSPFLVPLVAHWRSGWTEGPLFFEMTHRTDASGSWKPAPVARGPRP